MRIEKIRNTVDALEWCLDQVGHAVLAIAIGALPFVMTGSIPFAMCFAAAGLMVREFVQWFSKDRTGAGWLQYIDPVLDVVLGVAGASLILVWAF